MNDELFESFAEAASERRPLSVSELNTSVRAVLESEFSAVWVEGEVVNFVAHSSGHWYFNLKDGKASVKCVCWKGTNVRIRYRPENGNVIRVRGKVTLWETAGSYQLQVESLEPAGEGALLAAFEQIRAKLGSEGLLDQALKRPLPFFPRKVGVVTAQRRGFPRHHVSSYAKGAFCEHRICSGTCSRRRLSGQHSTLSKHLTNSLSRLRRPKGST